MGKKTRVFFFQSAPTTNFEQVGRKFCLNSLSGKQMRVSSIILIDPSSPQMIFWVGRNRVPIAKHDHVLWVPSSFSDLYVFQQDRTVVQEMSCLIAYETAIACSPWMRMIHTLRARETGQ